MTYIIVQALPEFGFDGVDAMLNEEATAIKTFKTKEEAARFLSSVGINELEFGFQYDITIQGLH
tara:strand:- start:437 stop:628 length:192 start_codon:yes stop_codon:yes gene_type:complete